MSTEVRAGVLILGLMVLVIAPLAFWALWQRQTLLQDNQRLHGEITDDGTRIEKLKTQAQQLQDTADSLNKQIKQAQDDKSQAQNLYDDLKQKADSLQGKLDKASSDENEWKDRVETISRERDDLIQKFKNRPEKIIYKDRIAQAAAPSADDNSTSGGAAVEVMSGPQGDQYWASVLKQKAALQVKLDKQNSELDQAALQVVSLKKQNSDLEVEVKQLSTEKDDIVQKIKYGQDLSDNLSIDLARARNDQQAANNRADKLKEENFELLNQIKGMSSTKLQLERNIARLTDDKDAMQKKLIETESVIQSRIDDIWKIKAGLDRRLSQNSAPASSPSSTELPPIVVNASSNQQQTAVMPEVNTPPAAGVAGKSEGSIISINASNNFVIVDLGQENSSVSVGNSMKVYRDSNEIATLEVIQVRRDICAADIKSKSGELKVGDIVKLN